MLHELDLRSVTDARRARIEAQVEVETDGSGQLAGDDQGQVRDTCTLDPADLGSRQPDRSADDCLGEVGRQSCLAYAEREVAKRLLTFERAAVDRPLFACHATILSNVSWL